MTKTKILVLFGVVVMMTINPCAFSASPRQRTRTHPQTSTYIGWRLGIQAWTFNNYTFYEAIDKTASLGLDYIEAYPGQPLSKEKKDVKFSHDSPADIRNEVKAKLKDAGIRLVNYGVVGLPNNEEKARKVFDFAKDMDIRTIVSEPPEDAFDMLDKLCKEYRINLAIHNHPKPSRYWNPDTVAKVCEGRSKYIGACADTGHWVKSGLDPLECLKKLEGRIKSLHIKEIADGHDVIWGTRDARMKPILEELHRQKFRGVMSIEYEYNWKNSVPDIRKCVAFYDKVAGGLKPSGWRDLFASDFSNADMKPGSWAIEEGVLIRKGGGDLWTKDKYGDFILDLEYKVAKGSNSGVFIRTGDHNWLPWLEVQIQDDFGKPISRHLSGGIFDRLAPAKNASKEVGKWNHMTIYAKANKVKVALNNETVVDMDLDLWDTAHKNPDGSKNKFNVPAKDLPRSGFISLQDHGQDISYRNVKIKVLK